MRLPCLPRQQPIWRAARLLLRLSEAVLATGLGAAPSLPSPLVPLTNLRARGRTGLPKPARLGKSQCGARPDWHAQQLGVPTALGERADGDAFRPIEQIRLHHDRRARLAGTKALARRGSMLGPRSQSVSNGSRPVSPWGSIPPPGSLRCFTPCDRRPLWILYARIADCTWNLDALPPDIPRTNNRGVSMLDIFLPLLGLGSFALMAGYAACCARI